MDNRIALTKGAVVCDKMLQYRIIRLAGIGASSIVYEAEYRDDILPEITHKVLLKELFPYEVNGRIYRNEDGRIVCDSSAADFYELHKRSCLRGIKYHLELQNCQADQTTININSFHANDTYYTVLAYSNGRTLKQAIEDGIYTSLADVTCCMINILDALKVFHENGLLHLDISPDNILLLPLKNSSTERGRNVVLIDYNSTWNLQELNECTGITLSRKEAYSAPEVYMHRIRDIAASTDLFTICVIFYECIFGETPDMTLLTEGGKLVVDSDIGLLSEASETTKQKVVSILHKGLRLSPGQRYRNITELQEDLNELLNRIEGVGITHAALWEASAGRFRKQVEHNPVYAYLYEEDLFHEITRAELNRGENSFLLGGGGIGKTTALLHIWQEGIRTYRPNFPVPVYIPLYQYKPTTIPYIQSCLLERLRFRSDTVTVLDALYRLRQFLDTPLLASDGCHASVCLLLDGINETTENVIPLAEEIEDLSKLRGVRIILTSRTENNRFGFRKIIVLPLVEKQVARYLSDRHLSIPSDQDLLRLLQNPMMLTIYTSLCLEQESNLQVNGKQELLEAYFQNMLGKILQNPGEESVQKYHRARYAGEYLLPSLADKMKRGSDLTSTECYHIIAKCFQQLHKEEFFHVFYEFTGKSKMILGDHGSLDSWYELMIRDLLQKELALFSEDEIGVFHFTHDNFKEVFQKKAVMNKKRWRKHPWSRVLLFG